MDEVIYKLKPFCAPHRYIFSDPDKYRIFQAPNKQSLINQVVNYRAQNQLEPIPNLSTVIENYWCGLPENVGLCMPVKLNRDFFTGLKGGVTLIFKRLLNRFVDLKEANRRAQICIGCPHNKFPDKGPYTEWADQVAVELVGSRKSPYNYALGNCEVCSCPLRAKIFIKGPFDLKPEWETKMQKVGCWQLEKKE